MKQGKLYLRILVFAFFAAVAAYMIIAVASAVTDPFATTVAIPYEASEYTLVEGVVIREETALWSNYAITTPLLEGGEKVGAGQSLALGYLTQADAQSRADLEQLTRRLEQLEAVYDTQLTSAQVPRLEEQISKAVVALNAARASGDWAGAAQGGWEVQTAVLQRLSQSEDRTALAAQIDTLSSQLSALGQGGAGAGTVLTAAQAGWYTDGSDGLEALLTPASALELTPADLDALQAQAGDTGAYGRLITDATWYYAAVMDRDIAGQVRNLGTVNVAFSGQTDLQAQMRVVQVGLADENHQCVVVLSADVGLTQAAGLRFAEAGVVFSTCAGLRVPKSAIRLEALTPQDEDAPVYAAAQDTQPQYRTGVYVVEGGRAVFKEVEVLLDTGSAYVVREDSTSTDNLWPGDEIIISAKNLFDGKVVR